MSGLKQVVSCALMIVAALSTAITHADDVFHMPTGMTSLEMVTVGNPGNAADVRYVYPGHGAVDYTYSIGKYEVTAGQYTAFLNAVAKTDTYGLYSEYMDLDVYPYADYYGCNIKRSGDSGGYRYSIASDWYNRPVNYVSFWDAARFCNWLHNGQDDGDTETGAYTLDGYNGPDGRTISHNTGAKWFIPSVDEWYKAAYYDPNKPGGAGYWSYPTKSDSAPINTLLSPDPGNHANCFDYDGTGNNNYTIGSPYFRTEVGAFANSASGYGTFDQGGNVWEWNETVVTDSTRGMRGGAFGSYDGLVASYSLDDYPTSAGAGLGFRVAFVPEPGSITLLLAGAISLYAYAWRRRRPAA